MTLYTSYPSAIAVVDFEQKLAAVVTCVDEACSEVKLIDAAHTVESWRELSAQIEQALAAIHKGAGINMTPNA